MNNVSKSKQINSVHAFSSLLSSVKDEYNNLKEEVKNCDLEIIDIMHKIEVDDISVYDGYILSLKIKEVRLRRRQFKNKLALLDPIIIFMNNNKNISANIQKLSTDILSRANKLRLGIYVPRIRTDLDFSVDNTPGTQKTTSEELLEQQLQ